MVISLKEVSDLNLIIRKRLFHSLSYLSTFAGKEYEFRISQQETIFLKKPLSPFLYALNKKILSSIEKGKIKEAKYFFNYIPLFQSEFKFICNYNDFSKIQKSLFTLYSNTENNGCKSFTKVKDFLSVKKNLYNSISLLKTFAEYKSFFVEELVKTIIVFNSNKIIAGSSSEFFGAIYINEHYISSNLYENIELILHEACHLYLYMFSFFDELVSNSSNELFLSPIRKDKRTMTSLFHGAFVIKKLINFYENNAKNIPSSKQRLATLRYNIKALEKCIKKNGQLTEVGERLLSI